MNLSVERVGRAILAGVLVGLGVALVLYVLSLLLSVSIAIKAWALIAGAAYALYVLLTGNRTNTL